MTGVLVTVPASATEPTKEASTSVKAMSKQVQEFDGVEGIQAYGTDGEGNVVVVTLPESELDDEGIEKIEAFKGEYSNVEVIEIAKPLQAYAKNQLVGGAGYAVTGQGVEDAGLCSVGFTAWDPNGDPAVITAGHCTGDDSMNLATRTLPSLDTAFTGEDNPRLMDPAPMGAFAFSQFGGPGHSEGAKNDANSTDIAVIDVDNPDLELLPQVTDWSTAGDDDLAAGIETTITAVGAPQEGQPVSKSGRTTGLTHDDDLDIVDGWSRVGVSGTDYRWVRGFAANGLEGAPGDSGGAIFQGSTAIGVVSGGTPAEGGNESFLWGTSLVHALPHTDGYTVALFVEAPKVTTTEVEQGARVPGTAPAGAEVTVTPVGGGEPITVTADDSGNWSFEAPQELGEQEYTAVARQGEYNVSDEASFAITVVEASDDEPTPPTPEPDPTDDPAPTPTDDPSDEPTEDPSATPTEDPTTPAPTDEPTEEAPAERELTIDPRRVSVSDFVNEDEGVNITGTGYAPGQVVELEVFPQNDSVNDFTLEGTADENGVVTFGVYGTNAANADVYLGTYEVRVAAASDDDAANAGSEAAPAAGAYAAGDADEPLTGSFEVVADEGAAPGEDEDENGDGNLPRTGTELTGLGVGAGLLVVGAAAVYVTTRRTKKGQA
ncbi:trypsin-like serine protease [Brevibacterium sp. CS2]|nr:trypsin-like serine protease [Brevibacterium sp. CS2]